MLSDLRTATALLVAGALATAHPAAAQSRRDSILVTPQALAAQLNDPKLVVLHVGQRAAYDSVHIAGARFVELRTISVVDLSVPGGLVLQLPGADSLRTILEQLGISDDSKIVVAHGTGSVSQATRVVFTLDYAGIGARTALLDGGVAAWIRAGLPTTGVAAAPARGRLAPLATSASSVVSAEWVRDSISRPGIRLIDARASGFYDGAQDGGPQGATRRGHIPGAVNIPFTSLTNQRGELLPPAQLSERFSAAGVNAGDTVIAYCHIGQQATVVVFAARSLGINVRLFDGSFEEWARRGWPVALPSPNGR